MDSRGVAPPFIKPTHQLQTCPEAMTGKIVCWNCTGKHVLMGFSMHISVTIGAIKIRATQKVFLNDSCTFLSVMWIVCGPDDTPIVPSMSRIR